MVSSTSSATVSHGSSKNGGLFSSCWNSDRTPARSRPVRRLPPRSALPRSRWCPPRRQRRSPTARRRTAACSAPAGTPIGRQRVADRCVVFLRDQRYPVRDGVLHVVSDGLPRLVEERRLVQLLLELRSDASA